MAIIPNFSCVTFSDPNVIAIKRDAADCFRVASMSILHNLRIKCLIMADFWKNLLAHKLGGSAIEKLAIYYSCN